jgi:hypothetical protein
MSGTRGGLHSRSACANRRCQDQANIGSHRLIFSKTVRVAREDHFQATDGAGLIKLTVLRIEGT